MQRGSSGRALGHDVEELGLGGLPRHRSQPVEGPSVDLAGHRDPSLVLEPAHGLDGAGVVDAGDVAGPPAQLLEPGLEAAHGQAAVAGGEQGGARRVDVVQRPRGWGRW